MIDMHESTELPNRDFDRARTLQLFLASQGQVKLGRTDRAHELLGECLASEPDNLLVAEAFANNWRNLATASAESQRRRWPRLRSRSLRSAVARLSKNPTDDTAMVDLILLLRPQVSAEVLLVVLLPMCSAKPDLEAIWQAAAELLTQVGRWEEAIEYWSQLVRLAPQNAVALETLAGLRSIAAAGASFENDSQNDKAQGIVWGKAKEDTVLDRMQSLAECAIAEANRGQSDLFDSLANHLQQKYRDTALAIYRARVDRCPEEISFRRELVRLLRESGNPQAVDAALETAPAPIEDPWLLAEVAELRQRQRQFESALATYQLAIQRFGVDLDLGFQIRILDQASELAQAMSKWDLSEMWNQIGLKLDSDPQKWRARLDKIASLRHK